MAKEERITIGFKEDLQNHQEFRSKVIDVNNVLFKHKGIHNHYVIHLAQLQDSDFYTAAFNELVEYGMAKAQWWYAKEFKKFIEKHKGKTKKEIIVALDKFWKPFNTKKHLNECDICIELEENPKDHVRNEL